MLTIKEINDNANFNVFNETIRQASFKKYQYYLDEGYFQYDISLVELKNYKRNNDNTINSYPFYPAAYEYVTKNKLNLILSVVIHIGNVTSSVFSIHINDESETLLIDNETDSLNVLIYQSKNGNRYLFIDELKDNGDI